MIATSGKVGHVASAVRSHLFLLCPNNSGSTFLSQAIARSPHVWSLPTEGQHVFGFAGPSTRGTPWPLIWAGSAQTTAYFADARYDWERIRKTWYFHAEANNSDAPIFHTRSPPFLLLAGQLNDNFRDARFLIMVRDPYAALEGIVRRRRHVPELGEDPDLATMAARHLVECFKRQLANRVRFADRSLFLTYEEMCSDPGATATKIGRLAPGLGPIDLTQEQSVKGMYKEALRNMNAEQIGRLTAQDAEAATAVFRENLDVLEAFGYGLR